MLQVDIGALERRPVDISGTLAADDPLFRDLAFDLGEPVVVSGRLTSATVGRFYWHGKIVTTVNAVCRRCLSPASLPITAAVDVVFTEDQDSDDPSEYVVPEGMHVLELHDAVREELILAMPDYLVCREDCKGLCPSCGADLNVEPCDCKPATDPRWQALDALKTGLDG
ncbi:MAG: DUF177 domain-containing protein [Gemmatimonadetes bacterium]|nr:DUF177 domain-containing protein [Gemmatimonadota bacterium]